jgi:hypothetical protein
MYISSFQCLVWVLIVVCYSNKEPVLKASEKKLQKKI